MREGDAYCSVAREQADMFQLRCRYHSHRREAVKPNAGIFGRAYFGLKL
jgi:hypothetical protein